MLVGCLRQLLLPGVIFDGRAFVPGLGGAPGRLGAVSKVWRKPGLGMTATD